MTKNALLSVHNKTGIVEFAEALINNGWTLYSSGGTASAIAAAHLPVTDVKVLTGFPAILGHRVVTLHPKVHGGILARTDNPDDQTDMADYGIQPFSLVVVNLYPFASDPSVDMIDVGGPTMVRGAAKNHAYVGVVTNPDQYQLVLDELVATDELSNATRERLSIEAFAHTTRYELAISEWKSGGQNIGFFGEKVEDLKYGENPYMTPAALYVTEGDDPLAIHKFQLVEGDARSLVGLTDVDRLLQIVTHIAAGYELNFGEVPLIAVGVKHGNACGAAVGSDPVDVIKRMIAGDKRAIFGGVIMTNFPITREVAEELKRMEQGDPPRMFDGVFAPSFDADAPEVLKRHLGKCRMMASPALAELNINSLDSARRFKQVRGGFLLQPNYTFVLDIRKSVIYGETPNDSQLEDLVLAWAIGCASNSNTITLTRDGQLLGNGVGQQDRVGAAELAIKRATDAGHSLTGSVAWSDSFFPAPDGLQVLAKAGVTVIFASSGSKQDAVVIAEADEYQITLLTQPDSDARGFFGHGV
jgi:phosphoribosylaminoimidazolecarboxamide formyltransferase/IMP cyclohydrolase